MIMMYFAGDEGTVVEDDGTDRPYKVLSSDGKDWWYDRGAIVVVEQDVTKNGNGDIVRKGSAQDTNGGFTGLKPSQIWYCGKYKVPLQIRSLSLAHGLRASVSVLP
jgi:hypothetical protein